MIASGVLNTVTDVRSKPPLLSPSASSQLGGTVTTAPAESVCGLASVGLGSDCVARGGAAAESSWSAPPHAPRSTPRTKAPHSVCRVMGGKLAPQHHRWCPLPVLVERPLGVLWS